MENWFDTSDDAKVAAKKQIEQEFNLSTEEVDYLESCMLDITAMAEEAKQVYEKLHATVKDVQDSKDVGHKSLVKISQEKSKYDELLKEKLDNIQELETQISSQIRDIKKSRDTIDSKATDAVTKIKQIEAMTDNKIADFNSQYDALKTYLARMEQSGEEFDTVLTDWIKTTNDNQAVFDKKVIETNTFFNTVKEDQNVLKQRLAMWSEQFESMCETVRTVIDGKKHMLDTLETQVAAKVKEVETVREDAIRYVSNLTSKKENAEKLVAEYRRHIRQYDSELEKHYTETIDNINDFQVEGEAAYSILKAKDQEAQEAYETLMRIAEERTELLKKVAETFTKAELAAQNSEQYLQNLEERYINSIRQRAQIYEVTESKFANSAPRHYDVLDPDMGIAETMDRITHLNQAYARSTQASQASQASQAPQEQPAPVTQGYEDYQTDLNQDFHFEMPNYQPQVKQKPQQQPQPQPEPVYQGIQQQTQNDMWSISSALQEQEEELLLQVSNSNNYYNNAYEGETGYLEEQPQMYDGYGSYADPAYINDYEQGYFDEPVMPQAQPEEEEQPKKGLTGNLFGKFKKK